MTFTTGMCSHMATEDLINKANFVKILGLGGKNFLNFARNPIQPTLGIEEEDYVTFGGRRLVLPETYALLQPGKPAFPALCQRPSTVKPTVKVEDDVMLEGQTFNI